MIHFIVICQLGNKTTTHICEVITTYTIAYLKEETGAALFVEISVNYKFTNLFSICHALVLQYSTLSANSRIWPGTKIYEPEVI